MAETKYLHIGSRVPWHYFWDKGTGQSNLGVHAGAFDDAVESMNIENFNFIWYSSLMPGIARKVDKPKKETFEVTVKGRNIPLVFGSVCEGIRAEAVAGFKERATAGLGVGWIYDTETNKRYGGMVAECYGDKSEDEVRGTIGDMLKQMSSRRFSRRKNLELREPLEIVTDSVFSDKKYATALVVIGFLDYIYPLYGEIAAKEIDSLYAIEPKPLQPLDVQDAAGKDKANSQGNQAQGQNP